jgi:hypothetical protein
MKPLVDSQASLSTLDEGFWVLEVEALHDLALKVFLFLPPSIHKPYVILNKEKNIKKRPKID